MYSFVGIAIVADEHLAPSLETLCHRLSLSEDVAGASFLALGSAAPEIIIAAVSTAKSLLAGDETREAREKGAFAQSLGIASILGSGMMAFTLIPGLCAMAVPKPMALKRRPLARDAIFYSFSLGALYYIIEKGHADFSDAVIMLIMYAVYLSFTAAAPFARECYRVKVLNKWRKSSPMEKGEAAGLDEELNGEEDGDDDDDEEAGPLKQLLSLPFKPVGAILSATCPECEVGSETEHLYYITMVVAFGWLALFSTALSAAITRWGVLLDVPGTAMGMFVVAVGAQIPDTVQAIAVAKRGLGSMAVASAVGSQVGPARAWPYALFGRLGPPFLGHLPWAVLHGPPGPPPAARHSFRSLPLKPAHSRCCPLTPLATDSNPVAPSGDEHPDWAWAAVDHLHERWLADYHPQSGRAQDDGVPDGQHIAIEPKAERGRWPRCRDRSAALEAIALGCHRPLSLSLSLSLLTRALAARCHC